MNIKKNVVGVGKLTRWLVIILFVVASIGICVFNFTDAQKNDDTSNENTSLADAISDHTGLFDQGPTAKNYLSNGDFYSQDKPRKLIIDTSYIDKVESAIWWYDKVITEFPGTEEANIALRSKIKTLIGWTDGYGKDKKYYGLHSRVRGRYFPLVESTFLELEVGYPDDPYLEALSYQIAQQYLFHILVYGSKHYNDECKRWLEKTIELARGEDTFYSHLAKLRLSLVETEKPKTEKPKHEAFTR